LGALSSRRDPSEFEDQREYRGRRAVILGIIWIVLGAAFELYPGLMR